MMHWLLKTIQKGKCLHYLLLKKIQFFFDEFLLKEKYVTIVIKLDKQTYIVYLLTIFLIINEIYIF